MPKTKRTTDVSTPASYQTADDEVDTLNITEMIQQVSPSRIPSMSDRQKGKALTMLTQRDAVISC